MTKRRFAAASLAVGLLAASCGGSAEVETATVPLDDDTTASDAAIDDALGLPTISAPTSDGDTIDFADLAGEDVMLWFWAPW